MDYCNGVENMINYTLSDLKNINGDGIKYLYKRCKIKGFSIHILSRCIFYKKRLMNKYLYWFAHKEPYVPYEIMIERMVESTSSSSNMHEDVDDNINRYRSMIMDTIKMNQDYTNICSILDEKQNADAARFFKHLKDYDDLLWVGCTNQSKLSVIVQVFTIQSDYG
jgi:hypothetical protein